LADLVLHTCRDPRRLLLHAADGFLRPADAAAAFPTPSYWLILRQGGLRDDLLRLAAERGVHGWFDPPIALIQELPDRLAGFGEPAFVPQAVGDFERLVLVARALRESAGRAFGRVREIDDYADAVDRWIGELLSEGIGPAELREVQRAIASGDDFERGRDAELLKSYARYLELLEESGRRDGRARLIDCAAAVRSDADAIAARLGGRRELRLVGLSDPRGGWPALLRALKECPALDRVAVYAAEPLDFLVQLADDIIGLEPSSHFTSALFGEDGGEGGPAAADLAAMPAVTLLSAPDLPREVDAVAVRVRALLDGEGAAPHRIAVVSRSARPYADHVLRALARLNVPTTARVRHALAEVPAVRALLALFHVAASGWERVGLVELAETPYFRARLDASVLNHIGYQRRVSGLSRWTAALAALLEAARDRDEALERDPDNEDVRRRALPATQRIVRALADFEEFAALARDLDEARSIAGWLDWLDAFITTDPWRLDASMFRVPGARLDVVRTDRAGWERGLRRVVAEWREAEQHWGDGARVGVAAFDARLRAMLDGDVALFTPVRRGVQVLEGLAAAFRGFDHVFILGMDSARVPLRAPPSPLLDEYGRRALREAGLRIDSRQQWDERERALFLNLLASPSTTLTLSWSRYDESGAEQLPSAFIDEVQQTFGLEPEVIPGSDAFSTGVPLAADAAALERGAHAAEIEALRATGALTPYSGRIEDPRTLEWLATELGESRIWSPTQIESYAKCGWAYFAERLLRLSRVEDPDLDIDPRVRGSILHDALRRFYTTAKERQGGPVRLLPADLPWAEELAARAIAEAISHARQSTWVGHPALEAQKLAELSRQLLAFVRWEAEDNEKAESSNRVKSSKYVRTAVEAHEVEFADLPVEIDGVRLRIRGFIDRVEVGADERCNAGHLVAAVDYKTTKYSTPGKGDAKAWDEGVVLQVPLYALALEQLRPGARAALVEYRAIKGRERVHTLPLYRFEKQVLSEDGEARDQHESALNHVARHIRAARGGEFAADPPSTCNCPSFCHARDICRIPGGPRSSW
jgi:RecB family exonuclease